ncbi:E3 ubiquitin protein ligase DRIP2 [Dendrobium catenatum]|uniref:E3 ubiquitin protein ligase DRIP2 n=1 Tax=Dendrobium catenatum TaxID=906689 RepID=A0A2I0WHF5_9ASPA|nr:E3 ubiquitin protein ligase DRIP2 [Dendrobium catenatum]
MTPERSLLLRHCNNYGAGFFTDSHFVFPQPIKSPLIPILMAEEGPSNSSSKKPVEKEQEKEQEQEEQRAPTYEAGWLQLGLAASAPAPSTSTSYGIGRFGWRPESSGSAEVAAPAYADELRVISPPPRAPSGIWIALRPAENQVKEPFLPQLPKSYLRIKDVRMTIRLLMRYLANKLGLHDESEVEISCRNQQLMPFATLEDVRDHIWFVRDSEAPGPSSPPTDHVMKLYYRRRA